MGMKESEEKRTVMDSSPSKLFLFLGEGNFSFSTSLALSMEFRSSKSDLIATDFVPELKKDLEDPTNIEVSGENETIAVRTKEKASFSADLIRKNVSTLRSLGHLVLFDVDATKLRENINIISQIQNKVYSKIYVIFNFPHVKSKKMKIGLNRDLLRNFFQSCDKLVHEFNQTEITPIVSLCSGQSGIPEVEKVPREWGDSWQVNDMAAHGNFVCISICNFEDWELFKLTRSTPESCEKTYQSSYYRLQTGVSFTTEDSLTFTYQHHEHIDPKKVDRMQSLKFSSTLQNEIRQNFCKTFSPIVKERFICANHDVNSAKDSKVGRPYHHIVYLMDDENPEEKVLEYLRESLDSAEVQVKVEGKRLCVKRPTDEESVIIGEKCNEDKSTLIFADNLIELKYGSDYRHLMLNEFPPRSLYPHIHEFHISFWIGPGFSMDEFMETLVNVYGPMLKSAELLEEYVSESGRKSICWKIQVQSLDLPLSRQCAHEMYLTLREQLSEKLEVDVR